MTYLKKKLKIEFQFNVLLSKRLGLFKINFIFLYFIYSILMYGKLENRSNKIF